MGVAPVASAVRLSHVGDHRLRALAFDLESGDECVLRLYCQRFRAMSKSQANGIFNDHLAASENRSVSFRAIIPLASARRSGRTSRPQRTKYSFAPSRNDLPMLAVPSSGLVSGAAAMITTGSTENSGSDPSWRLSA